MWAGPITLNEDRMKHIYKQIQGWCSFIPWYRQAVKEAPKVSPSTFVELGTWKGKSAAYMAVEIANSGKPIRFFTVDWFLGSDEPVHHADPIVQKGQLEQHARKNLAPVGGFCRVIKHDTSTFADQFSDGSIDFVLVDADHTYEGVTKDLEAWWPKLKPGCKMAGDDYRWKGVRQAVDEFFGARGVEVKTDFGADGDKCWIVRKPNVR